MVNFPTRIPDCDSHNPALMDLFLTSDASICSTMAFPLLGNSDHVVVSVSIDFPTNSQWDAPFYCIAYDYFCAYWDGFHDHLRDAPWEDIFKLSASAAASEFCEWVQVGMDVYIPHRKYQVKPHSSPWFSAACAAAIVHRNHFFVCSKEKNLLILNYRPVSLLSVVSKVFEKLVNNRIVDHLDKCGLFSDFQCGFRSSQSTADLLTVVSDRIARAFNRSGATRAVASDISKAFDRVWHAVLLRKLKSYGI